MTDAEGVRRLEAVGFIAWLLKDAGWVLLFPALSMLAASVAVCVEAYLLLLQWKVEPAEKFVHRMAMFVWLVGNVEWMLFEFLFEPLPEHGHQFLWYHGPLLDANQQRCNSGLHTAGGIFALGLATLLSFYASSALQLMNSTSRKAAEKTHSPRSELVMGLFTPEVYSWIFIGPWLAKDLCWLLELFRCGMTFDLVVIMLHIDYMRMFRSYNSVAGFLWVIANTIWIYGELRLDDAYLWPRITAGLTLLADCMLVIMAFHRDAQSTRENTPEMLSPRGPRYGSSDGA